MTAASRLALSTLFLLIPRCVDSGSCFHCISKLKFDDGDPASLASSQTTMRVMLDQMYNVPPANSLCATADDYMFETVDRIDCPGKCIKVSTTSGTLNFVIRGCAATLYKNKKITPNIALRCGINEQPSVCTCTGSSCNSVQSTKQPSSMTTFAIASALSVFL